MTEHEFRLTPVDVRTQEFGKAFRGVDAAAVEDFRSRVADELERVLKERAAFEKKVEALNVEVDSLRKREQAINEALVLAQQVKEDARTAAERGADLVLREARATADELVREARMTEQQLRRNIETVQHQFSSYVSSFRRLLDRHTAQIDGLAEFEHDGRPPEAT